MRGEFEDGRNIGQIPREGLPSRSSTDAKCEESLDQEPDRRDCTLRTDRYNRLGMRIAAVCQSASSRGPTSLESQSEEPSFFSVGWGITRGCVMSTRAREHK